MKDNFPGCEVGQLDIVNEMEYQDLSELLGVLSNKTRLAILALALKHGEVCACKLQQSLGLPQPTITVHLQKLYSARVLKKRESWRYTYYSIRKEYEQFVRIILAEKSTVEGNVHREGD